MSRSPKPTPVCPTCGAGATPKHGRDLYFDPEPRLAATLFWFCPKCCGPAFCVTPPKGAP